MRGVVTGTGMLQEAKAVPLPYLVEVALAEVSDLDKGVPEIITAENERASPERVGTASPYSVPKEVDGPTGPPEGPQEEAQVEEARAS